MTTEEWVSLNSKVERQKREHLLHNRTDISVNRVLSVYRHYSTGTPGLMSFVYPFRFYQFLSVFSFHNLLIFGKHHFALLVKGGGEC